MNRFVQDETDLSSDIYKDRDQTYLDFIQTLRQRESLLKFVKNWKEEIRSVRPFSDKEEL